MQPGYRLAPGFTIVEILVVIVMISILAAIALPSYREYVMRTNRTVAKVALQDLLSRQESYATQHKGYAADFGQLAITGTGGAATAYVTSDGVISLNTANALYSFSLASNTGGAVSSCTLSALDKTAPIQHFGLIATPAGTNPDTRCGKLCVTTESDRGAEKGTVADCWRR